MKNEEKFCKCGQKMIYDTISDTSKCYKCNEVKTNEDLKEVYNKGELEFYPGFMESLMLLQMIAPDTWQGKTVLEIGCGEGHLASMIHYAGATSVRGVDYSKSAIKKATTYYNKPDLTFKEHDIPYVNSKYEPQDVIVMQGVLEHLDDPFRVLKTIMNKNLTTTGTMILSVPNWSNPRGYVYHTCRILYDAKMTLTDLHFFGTRDFIEFSDKNGYKLTAVTTDIGLGMGEDMIKDLTRRLPLADPNVKPESVKQLMAFMDKNIPYTQEGELSGATIGYKLEKMPVQGGA